MASSTVPSILHCARAELRSRRQSVQSEAFPLYLGWHLRSTHHRVWYVWKAFFKRKAIVFLEFTYLYTVIIICRNCSTYTAMIFFFSFFKRTSPQLRHVNWDLSRNEDASVHILGLSRLLITESSTIFRYLFPTCVARQRWRATNVHRPAGPIKGMYFLRFYTKADN